jgi:translocation and assembly module TamA
MSRLFFLFFIPIFGTALDYEVRFIGLEDKAALNSILESSQLVSLQHRPPASINGLRYRIAADIPILMRVLHAYAYYDSSIDSSIVNTDSTLRVDLKIHPGPQFSLRSYHVYHGPDCTQLATLSGCIPLTSDQLGLKLGSPAISTSIIDAELKALDELSKCGYPLAKFYKRRVEVDMADQSVSADSCLNEGPLTRFGPAIYFGVKQINPRLLEKKLSWQQGDLFNSDLLEETQERLLKTELFSSVVITHCDKVDERGELPINLRISEAKHKKFTLGLFYATVEGFGGNVTWTNRNIGGMGETLSVMLEYAQKASALNITFRNPDFYRFDQTYRAVFEASNEEIFAYHIGNDPLTSFFKFHQYRLANYIDKILGEKGFISFGLKADYINVNMSATNGVYFLLGLPFFAKYENLVEGLLDPKGGFSVSYSITPYQSIRESNVHFIKQRMTLTKYFSLNSSKSFVLAFRLQVGSIAGTKRENVPLPKLFLGGSEDEMRGYKYQTVSPVNSSHRPLGGRSCIFTSSELRMRVHENVGLVPFFDCGQVTNLQYPTIDTKWLKSIGIGLRLYFASFGPFRVDVGFPLDRREEIDKRFQIYASVGQSF